MKYRYPITIYCVTKIHILKFHVMQIRTFGSKRKTEHLIPWHWSTNVVLLYFIWELFMIHLFLSFQRDWNYVFHFNSGVHWFIKHFWNSVYVLGTLLDARDTMINKMCLISGLIEACRLLEKTGIKGRFTISILKCCGKRNTRYWEHCCGFIERVDIIECLSWESAVQTKA